MLSKSGFLCICETIIVGTSHVFGFAELRKELESGTELRLVREYENQYDGWAVRVEVPDSLGKGRKLGYLPRPLNQIPARLMDGGKVLCIRVSGFCYEDNAYERVKVKLYLKD